MYIQIKRGKLKWYWRIVGGNGEVMAHSQGYYSKGNALRAAHDLIEVFRLAGVDGMILKK